MYLIFLNFYIILSSTQYFSMAKFFFIASAYYYIIIILSARFVIWSVSPIHQIFIRFHQKIKGQIMFKSIGNHGLWLVDPVCQPIGGLVFNWKIGNKICPLINKYLYRSDWSDTRRYCIFEVYIFRRGLSHAKSNISKYYTALRYFWTNQEKIAHLYIIFLLYYY